MADKRVPITTEDDVIVFEGDNVYNYYDMVPGTIEHIMDIGGGWNGWFHFKPASGGQSTVLNGARICSLAFAKRRNFPNADHFDKIVN